jgi:hypothetical protein
MSAWQALTYRSAGPAFSGKSTVLDQAIAYARLSGWAILYLPTRA